MELYEKIRKEWLEGDLNRDKDLTDPPEVTRYDDIPYGPVEKWNLLDLYVPKNNDRSPIPVIVSIHGGGYVYGTKDIYQYYGMNLAKGGFAFINFNYRLAPEAMFPTALQETSMVMNWLYENAGKYNLDVDNVFMVGDSAGAHYTSLYLCAYCNPEYAELIGIKPEKRLKIKACALNCGVYNPLILREKDGLDELNAYLIGKDWKEKSDKYLCTYNYLTKDYPPVYLMSGLNDYLLPQFEPMKKHLDDLGIECVSKVYGEAEPDKAYHVFHVDMNNRFQQECNCDELKFFKAHIS